MIEAYLTHNKQTVPIRLDFEIHLSISESVKQCLKTLYDEL